MKREGYLYQKICNIDNIKIAILEASKKKKSRRDVKRVLSDLDYYALKLQNMLLNFSYTPIMPKQKHVYSKTQKKDRLVYVIPFYPDLCIQRAIVQQIEPILIKGMDHYSCGSVPGRGMHYAKKSIEKWIQKDVKYTKYCLQIDIDNFYPTINCGFLKNMFRKHIKDYNTLRLIDTIIDVTDNGLLMGYYTSPWFANFYLQEFDHYVKEQLHIKHYIRYSDNMCFFGNNKKKLHKAFNDIVEYLKGLGLTLNDDWQVYKVSARPVDFAGYRYFRDHTELRKKTSLRIKRRIKKIHKKKHLSYKDASAIVSYNGWTKKAACHLFYRKNVQPYVNIKKTKEVIRIESKKKNREQHKAAALRC